MKKITRILITLIMAVLSLTLFANADVALKLDGNPIPFEQPPVIVEGRTLVPFRAIFEALGAEVEWDDATKTATAEKEDLTVKITIGEKILYKNGEEIELDVPAMIVGEGYTMVPARAIAEAFGVVVEWEDTAQYVILITPTVKDEIPVITMYAADGRTVSVPKTAIEDYKRVGWYIEPVTQMWTVDGVSKYVYKSLAEDYKKLGWYTEPVIRMYAPDGRTIIIKKTVVEDYKKVGWYTEPVTLMYALDGRTKYVIKSQVEASKKVGWYTQPMIMMYAPNGKTIIIAKSAVEDYKKVGWYTEPVVIMYAPDGRTKYVIKSQVDANKKVGWMDREQFEEYLQPWVEASHIKNGEPTGSWIVVKDEYTNKHLGPFDSYYSSYSDLRERYQSPRYTILGAAQATIGKTKYTSINQVYDYLGQYFSKDLYPHEGDYGYYILDSGLFIGYDEFSGVPLGSGKYLGYINGHHYICRVTRSHGSWLSLTISELSTINNRLLITKRYNYSNTRYSNTNIDTVMSLLEECFKNGYVDYLNMSTVEASMLTMYFIEKYTSDGEMNIINEMSIEKTGDNSYHLSTNALHWYGGGISHFHDFYFTVQNGLPVLVGYSYEGI